MSFIFRRNKDAERSSEQIAEAADQAAHERLETPHGGETADREFFGEDQLNESYRHAISPKSIESTSNGHENSGVTRWRASHSHKSQNDESYLAKLIATAWEHWRAELTAASESDTTMKLMAATALNLTHIHPTGAAQFYSGASTMLSSLVREERAYQRSSQQLTKLHNLVKKLTDSYGYAHLELTAGRASWEKEGATVTTPMIKRGVKVDFLAHGDAKIQLRHGLSIHSDIAAALQAAGVPAEALKKIESAAEKGSTMESVLAQLNDLGRALLPEYSFESETLLGCFTHPATAMVADLDAMKPFVMGSGVMAALAGDEKIRALCSVSPLPGSPEDRSPEVERGVGDLDVEELHAVESVASGRSILLDSPPGSRRLATLVSIAADAAASGKSVLIIPSDAAAGRALERKFDEAGVGELVLNFWDTDDAAFRLRTGLRLEKPAVNKGEILAIREQLTAVRQKLATFVTDLHRVDPKWNESVHDVLERLAALMAQPDAPRTRVRFSAQSIADIEKRDASEIETKLLRAAELGILSGDLSDSLWLKADINSEENTAAALELVKSLARGIVPNTRNQCESVSESTGLVQAQNAAQWAEQVTMLAGISESLDTFLPKVFEQSPEDMVIATASKEWREAHGYEMKKSEQRMIRKQLGDLLRPGAVVQDVHTELLLVQERQEAWRVHSKDGGWPILPSGFTQIQAQSKETIDQLARLSQYFEGVDFAAMPWQELAASLDHLVAEEAQIETLTERNALIKELYQLGLEVFIDDMRRRHVAPDQLAKEFDLACTSSVFEQLMANSQVLASVGPHSVVALLQQLRELDTAHVASLTAPVLAASVAEMRKYARAHRDATLSADAVLGHYDEQSLREAIESYPHILQLARPVWIMPGGLVAEFLPAAPWADLCIYDASGETPLAVAISVVMRGRQLVIVGDTRRSQLLASAVTAPVSPAADAGDDAPKASADVISEFARVLPVVQLPTNRVQLNEITTKALNEHGYSGVYAPIPKAARAESAQLVMLDGRGMPTLGGDGAIETTSAEVEAVVDAIAEHALSKPEHSLAVVALNERHATRIREAFRAEAADSPVLRSFAALEREPFEILTLKQVAGLHRDHVILAVGYAKTVHGRMMHSFGVLAQPEGFLALVDAVEAARTKLTLISSLSAKDLRDSRISSAGPQLLASVLESAEQGFESKAGELDGVPVAPLVEDLEARLHEQGWVTARSFGYPGSARIPMVVGSAESPGIWLVAVLLDDDAYVAEASLRRRDRHRIEAYEEAGWKVFQTYSTSLFVDPAGQAKAIGDLAAQAQAERSRLNCGAANSQLDQPQLPDRIDTGLPGVVGAAPSEDEANADAELPSIETASKPVERGLRPQISVGLPIVAYSDDQLDDMLEWISSDNVARSAEELREELRAELGIERRGGQVDLVLGAVVRRSGIAVTKPSEGSEKVAESGGGSGE